MSRSLTLANLSWYGSDQKKIIDNLSFSIKNERIALIGPNGCGKTTLLKLIAGELQPTSGTITVEGSVGAMRQLLDVDNLQLIDLLGLRTHHNLLQKAEVGQATAEELAAIDWNLLSNCQSLLAKMNLNLPLDFKATSLSGGERMRASLAGTLLKSPDFLLLDEPTNNLDLEGRRIIVELLSSWTKGALVVTHDRELLSHFDYLIDLHNATASFFKGSYAQYTKAKQDENNRIEQKIAAQKVLLKKVKRQHQRDLERQAQKDKRGKLKAKNKDQPAVLLGAMKRKSEATGANLQKVKDAILDSAQNELEHAQSRKSVDVPINLPIVTCKLPSKQKVLVLQNAAFGFKKDAWFSSGIDLKITGAERVALTGKNGSGKSSLLSLIDNQLRYYKGREFVLANRALINQEAGHLAPSKTLLNNYLRLNPEATEHEAFKALATFGFRNKLAAKKTCELSGGEKVRAGLACLLGGPQPVQFLMLDEPANHLDLPSLELLENALKNYDGALLVVSHDQQFLQNVGITKTYKMPNS
ncbi:ABC-F family ATP-binding cassette domain-containing protein [Polycladidibacter stylochi]|uniref:ABC-F family ATP-binding cassette domain-containing protein n=1 Tax=Polycladidibacter stylochi TaxID=1807766 RepID=UPI0008360A21|nr:ATP-binding cassette domain-containing protein [Pseudovibrio stylochi]